MPLDGTSNRMRREDYWGLLEGIASIVAGLLLVGMCVLLISIWMPSSNKPVITDPRKGVVSVTEYTSKYCDGTTLVYEIDRGGTAVPNSPECEK